MKTKEQIEERLQKEAEAKTGKRLSAEQAHERAQKEVDKQEKKLHQAQQKQRELEKNMVAETVKKLRGKTIEQLDQAIEALDIYAKETVTATFTEQAHLLKAAIDEKLLEPLNAEIAQQQAIQKLLHEGEAAIKAKRASLEQGLKDITEIQRMTQALTLPLKNVSLAEWFNSDKENANDKNIKGSLHARIQARGSSLGGQRPKHRGGGTHAGGGRPDAVQLGEGA